MNKLKVGILCGGPSYERGISLNSARSLVDHLQATDIDVYPIYLDANKRAYEISRAQLYSNTPSDFDFKIESTGHPLSEEHFIKRLQSFDIVFPAIHGAYGEDGELQQFLEAINVPYLGSDSKACKQAFDKYAASLFLHEHGYYTLPSMIIEQTDLPNQLIKLESFFSENHIDQAVVKPVQGGSSIGVYLVNTPNEAIECMQLIASKGIDDRAIIEPFCKGAEFTLIIIENRFNQPVALLPIEIALEDGSNQIFDYRKKYLPTSQTTYYTPPRFSDQVIHRIQAEGEALFSLFGMRDFVRFDGWVLEDGNICFSDFNIISGMEQNSFLFMQAAQLGMSHASLLRYILKRACDRYDIPLIADAPGHNISQRKRVNIIFGGDSSERHVSLMSGTNVWLKLQRSEKYDPHPYLLDTSGTVWELPYAMALRHTVEEVTRVCEHALGVKSQLEKYREEIIAKLSPESAFINQTNFMPRRMTLNEFILESPIVFIALHGGIGENGELQTKLEAAKVPFTASDSQASNLGIDKYATSLALANLEKDGIYTAKKRLINTSSIERLKEDEFRELWESIREDLASESVIVKPSADGCSSGIVRLYNEADLQVYIKLILQGASRIPINTFQNQHGIIEMPAKKPLQLLFEEFIETDKVLIVGNSLEWKPKTNWIEITVGVLGAKGQMYALTPSITIASGNILSLEEKFQGGTGVNITPPPQPYVSVEAVTQARRRIEIVAKTLGISGFARIDAFLSTESGEIIVIEANTIPGLTPSTVIFQQALAEPKPMFPTDFLEKVLDYRIVL